MMTIKLKKCKSWGLWTYHMHLGVWTSTHHLYNKESMTNEQVEAIIRHWRPCLYLTCPCEHYGEKSCMTSNYERFILPMEKRLQKIPVEEKE